MSLIKLKAYFQEYADPIRANHSLRFFKTGKGQYGEGDQFLGLTNPTIRSAVSLYWKDISYADLFNLLSSKLHEYRLVAILILVKKYEKGTEVEKQIVYDFYTKNLKSINNWDLVDLSAHKIIGKHLLTRSRQILYQYADSSNIWLRRVSIISTFAFLKSGDTKDALKLSLHLIHDSHDLIHKAVGWVLREVGKHDLKQLITFLDKNSSIMPRTMLRYAIEKLPTSQYSYYLNLGKKKK